MLATDVLRCKRPDILPILSTSNRGVDQFINRVPIDLNRQRGGILTLPDGLLNFITVENAQKFAKFILPIIASFLLKKGVKKIEDLTSSEEKELTKKLKNIDEKRLDQLLDLIEDKIDDVQEDIVDKELEELITDKSRDILSKIISGSGINFI